MEYKVIVVTPFTDIHTQEEYKKGQELIVSEERALELLSSDYHLVKVVSREGENDIDSILAENDAIKAENATLKESVDNLTQENTTLKENIASLQKEVDTLKAAPDKKDGDKEQKDKK